jgi:hypothetical protein
LIDLDVSEELDIPFSEFASAPPEITERLVADVRGFGELLFNLATGRDPPTDHAPNPRTGNAIFDLLVETCLTSQADGPGYSCLADDGLWRDLKKALTVERAQKQRSHDDPLRQFISRRSLAGVGAVLFISLVAAVASRVFGG